MNTTNLPISHALLLAGRITCTPLIVAFISIAIVGETLSQQAGIAVVVIALGIMSLALTRGASGFREPKAMIYAVGTGVFIAGYTPDYLRMGARSLSSARSSAFDAPSLKKKFSCEAIPIGIKVNVLLGLIV
ncbi:hypothetical protein [Rhizobium jaguaris]|uniref:EamA domain-containing protein n=1 Tax=Rhizobium jaguaris TaxID=1312183 RepID=A0A387G874_9HYPH|nr:hypothetical protein [Rhizobium jaguaris]AYG64354.1 hypothetical protein CCGE525_37005 [Rhizobium jaguaris]